MLRTRIVSDRPGTPGRSEQMPRIHRSIGTPAIDAWYSASMVASSMIALHLIWIRAGSPSRTSRTCSSIRLIRPDRRPVGATPVGATSSR